MASRRRGVSRRIAVAVVLETSEGEIAWSCRVAAVALPIRTAKWQDLIKEKDESPCKPKILCCTAAPSRWL